MAKKRVAVIGAGPSGLAAIKELQTQFDVVCFEGNKNIGGLWNSNSDSSLYDSVITNTSKEYYRLILE